MASVGSRLYALCAKIQGLREPRTDTTHRGVSTACICIAMHDLGNAAVPSTRMRKNPSLRPVSTSQFIPDEDELIRKGCRGYVTKVRHRVTDKTFALKKVAGEGEEEIFNLGVLQEACFMAACGGHPSLIRLHAICRDPDTDRYCLAMEHMGPTLEEVLSRGLFPEHEAQRVTRQILSGAKAMHERGIVHSNIESNNVLMAAGGSDVKIGEFGQATCTSPGTDIPFTDKIWQVFDWAPEVLLKGEGALQSELVDSWSIGTLMAELVTGMPLLDLEGINTTFDVIGAPDKEDIKGMKIQDLDFAQDAMRKWRGSLSWRAAKGLGRLRKKVPRKVLSDQGFEVLRGLLTLNPKKRLTAAAALELPWFANDDNPPPAANNTVFSRRPFTWLLLATTAIFDGFCSVWPLP